MPSVPGLPARIRHLRPKSRHSPRAVCCQGPNCAARCSPSSRSWALTPSARPLPVSRPLPPSLWCRIITSVLSRWISRADPGLTAAIALPKKKQATDKTSTRQAARSLAFFLFSTTRETQKGTSTPGPIFSDQSLARSPPRPRLHRRQHATYCTVRGCLASRFPLSAFRSLSCCCWWHRIAVDVVWRKGSENSAPVEFPEFHPLSRPRPDQDEPAAGETDD